MTSAFESKSLDVYLKAELYSLKKFHWCNLWICLSISLFFFDFHNNFNVAVAIRYKTPAFYDCKRN